MQRGPKILTANKKVLIAGSNTAKPVFIVPNQKTQIYSINPIQAVMATT